MDVFVTAIGLDDTQQSAIKQAIKSGIRHGSKNFATGHRYIHIVLAQIARELGAEVTIYIPNVSSLTYSHLDAADRIVVTDSNIGRHYEFVAENVGSVIATSPGDPYVVHAKIKGKDVWYPASGKLECGNHKSARN